MRIDVWSDLVCPWCYIGKRRLEHALKDFSGAGDVEIVHRSFQLNPSAPVGVTSKRRDYLMKKYGWSDAQAEKIDKDMEARAAADGLEYHMSAEGLTGNTFEAHRLVHLASERGRQDAVVERFFRAYFTEQQPLFDAESLAALAVDAGLDADDVRRVLGGADYADAVMADMREAQALGVSGVPFFVFDQRLGLSGAQPLDVFADALAQAVAPCVIAVRPPPFFSSHPARGLHALPRMPGARALTRHPFVAAALFYTALAAVITFPLVLHFTSALPNDLGDPLLSTSILWWNAHVLPLTARWWDGFAFAPSTGMLAFSDHRLGLSLIASPLQWLGASPITAYNVVFLATFPLCALGAHALGFALTRRHDAATICGLAFGFNPFRAAHFAHLELLAAFAMPAALAALHMFVRDRRRRWIVLFAIALVVQGLCATYYLLFFSVMLMLWLIWFARGREWRVGAAVGAGSIAAIAALSPIALRYWQVHRFYGFSRLPSEVMYYSADLTSFVTASPLLRVWGFTSALDGNAERQIFPGLTITLLAIIGAVVAVRRHGATDGRWRRTSLACLAASCVLAAIAVSFEMAGAWRVHVLGIDIRVTDAYKPTTLAALALIAAVALQPSVRRAWQRRSTSAFYLVAAGFLFLCCMGPAPTFLGEPILYKPPYDWLMTLPGFDAVRAPARIAMPAMLALATAAAIGFDRLGLRPAMRRLVLGAVAAGILADAWTHPMPLPQPPALWPVPQNYAFGPVIELPLATGGGDFVAMYRATEHGHPVVNGNSGFIPPHYDALRLALDEGNIAVFDAFTASQPLLVVVDKRTDPDGRWVRSVRYHPAATAVANDDRWAIFGIPAHPPPPRCHGADLKIDAVTDAHGPVNVSALRDNDLSTSWRTWRPQLLDDALVIDLGRPARLCELRMSLGTSWNTYPRDLDVTTSPEGENWTRQFKGSTAPLVVRGAIENPKNIWMTAPLHDDKARFIRLRLDAPHLTEPWFIPELRVTGTRLDESP